MNVVAFDLEIAEVVTNWQDLDPIRGLGISCAALCWGGEPVVWHGGSPPYTLKYWKKVTPPVTPRLSQEEARELLDELQSEPDRVIVTWNGLSFDLHVLGVEAGDIESAARLAISDQHIDLMLLFASVRRHRLSLKAAALACNSHKGAGGIDSGEDAPKLWAAGQYQQALEYVAQDARATLDVFRHLVQHGGFTWTSRRGYEQTFALPEDLRDPESWTVRNILRRRWDEPKDWITDPTTPQDFTAWIPDEIYLFE